jgi:hypothetical protein
MGVKRIPASGRLPSGSYVKARRLFYMNMLVS